MSFNYPLWLRNAVLYEIYPQSFYDSNADGIGDIAGILQKLDYVQSLGVKVVWLNPCFASPFYDAGYDVADYYRVAPRYGTNAELIKLFKQADKRGIKIILDLVPGHTSIEHPWFRESSRPQKNKYSDWYIWTDSVWKSDTNFRMICGYAQRDGNYLANFFWSQPALNYGFAMPDPQKPWQLPPNHKTCKKIRQELRNIMKYWLDIGAAGFRVDMAPSLVKGDAKYDFKYTSEIWREVSQWLDVRYPQAVMISEWHDPPVAISAGFHSDFLCFYGDKGLPYSSLFRAESARDLVRESCGYSYFDRAGRGDINAFLEPFMQMYKKTRSNGLVCLYSGCHDIGRISFGRTERELEVVFAFILTMPVLPMIYYGDEIGMKPLNLPSKEGGYNRTGSRTPMQWSRAKNAGFSQALSDRLYLPIDPDRNRPCVSEHEKRSDSLLNTVRNLINLRENKVALWSDSGFEPLYSKNRGYPFVYKRYRGDKQAIIALNPSAKTVEARFKNNANIQTMELAAGRKLNFSFERGYCCVKMPPISYAIYTD